jgi:hypothetical protein
MTAPVMSTTSPDVTGASLSPRRVAVLRAAYGFVGVGLVVTRWPRVVDGNTLPRYEGVVLVMLTAMSVLMLLGPRHPVRMLPMLVFESLWKLIWIGTVALPLAASGGLDDGFTETLVACLFIVPVLLAVPWGYVWRTYFRDPGEAWR